MALSPTVTSMCNQLTQKYDGVVNPVKRSKNLIKSRTRLLISELDSANFSSFADLQDEIFALRAKVDGVLPGNSSSDVAEIRDFLERCLFFGDGVTAVGATRGSTYGVFDAIDDLIMQSYGSYDEFGAASIADSIDKLLNGLNFPRGNDISGSLSNADLLIQCLSSLCPGYESKVILYNNEVNSLYDELHIVSNPANQNYGSLDYDYVYSEAGMNSTQIDNMNFVNSEITAIKDEALVAINDSVRAIKDLNFGDLV